MKLTGGSGVFADGRLGASRTSSALHARPSARGTNRQRTTESPLVSGLPAYHSSTSIAIRFAARRFADHLSGEFRMANLARIKGLYHFGYPCRDAHDFVKSVYFLRSKWAALGNYSAHGSTRLSRSSTSRSSRKTSPMVEIKARNSISDKCREARRADEAWQRPITNCFRKRGS
jgi:hypothetical protein